MEALTCLTCSSPIIKRSVMLRSQFHNPGSQRLPTTAYRSTLRQSHLNDLPLHYSKILAWEASSPYSLPDDTASIIKGSNIVEPIDTEEATEFSSFEHQQAVIDMRNQQNLLQQPLKWPLWLLGPSLLLLTGMVPTLWLPLSSVFLGPNIAGLLSLLGLDCMFNMGATLFLLMADACARPKDKLQVLKIEVPLTYKLWNLFANIVGFVVPLAMLLASHKGTLHPHLPFISFSVLLVPYLLLLSVQILTETLTWHWRSPVWLLAPIVYEVYRVLQLMRGIRLGSEIGAPTWSVEGLRVLVSWWVLILGIQFMMVAWFSGYASRNQQQQS